MRKIFNIPTILSLAFLLALVSCEYQQEVADPISPDDYPVATITTDFSGTAVTEGDVITYTITIDKWLDHEVTFSAMIEGGTGSEDDIQNIGGVIDAYSDSTTLTVVFVQDLDADDGETLELEIGADYLGTQYTLNPSTVNPTLNVTITNWVSSELEMTFDWHGEVIVNDLTCGDVYNEDIGDYVDFDIFMADAEGYDFNDPWSYFNPYDYAATGDVPEEWTIGDTIPDGSYYFFCDLYANGLPGLDSIGYQVEHVPMPITATFTRAGAFDITVVQDDSQVISTAVPGGADDNFDPALVVTTTIAKLTVASGVYTISDIDDTVLASGKMSEFRIGSNRPIYLRK